MPHPRKQEPIKYCQSCGKPLSRKRYNGRLEDLGVFKRRNHCDLKCAGMTSRKDNPTYSALLKRATPHRGASCERCGATDNLHIHHINGNPADNAHTNLMTLCGSCHAKWHWEAGKTAPKTTDCCSICGTPLQRSWRGMCQKHYQRFKKYGSPYLTKRRDGSRYVLVKTD